MLMNSGGARRWQRGLSIVELMVGVTIGLLVVAAAAVMMSGQLVENRRLLVEAQIQQDLRAASDIITRDLRRSGYLAEVSVPLGSFNASIGGRPAPSSLQTLDSISATAVTGGTPVVSVPNLLHDRLVVSSGCGQQVRFAYVASESGSLRPDFGYDLSGGVLRSRVAGTQPVLTDSNTMNVTDFCVTVSAPTSERLPCPKLCTGNTTSCWPEYKVRTVSFTIKAEGRGVNSNIKREVTSTVRLRNDWVHLSAPPAIVGAPVQACPS